VWYPYRSKYMSLLDDASFVKVPKTKTVLDDASFVKVPKTKTVLCSRAYSFYSSVCSTLLWCTLSMYYWLESGKHVFNSHFRKGMDRSLTERTSFYCKGEVAHFVVSSPIFLLHFFSFSIISTSCTLDTFQYISLV
jgi:hypothetical protein